MPELKKSEAVAHRDLAIRYAKAGLVLAAQVHMGEAARLFLEAGEAGTAMFCQRLTD